MAQALRAAMTPEAFLAWEREQAERHGYWRGEVFSMAGGSPRHSRLAARCIARLDAALADRPCDVHTSDLRLALSEDHFAYADAVVVCRPITLRAGTTDVVTNPSFVIEVLSRSTEAYDRGEKLAGYLGLAEVTHYALIAQREPRVELYARQVDGAFRYTAHGPGGRIEVAPLGFTLAIDDLYAGVFELPGD